jgi:hypothetical protein
MNNRHRVCTGDCPGQVLEEVTASLSQNSSWWWCEAALGTAAMYGDTRVFRVLPSKSLLITGGTSLAGELSQLVEAGAAAGWSLLPVLPTRTPLKELAGLFRSLSGSVRYCNLLGRLHFTCAEELAALPDDCLRDLPGGTDRLVRTVHMLLAELGIPQSTAGLPQPRPVLPDQVSQLERRVDSLEATVFRLSTQLAARTP